VADSGNKTARPTLGDVEEPPELRPALGEQEAGEQDAVFEADEVEHGPTATMTDLDEADPAALDGELPLELADANLELLDATGLREGETDDPFEAAEEGLTYVPPTDPPVVPGDDGEPEVASGFGGTAFDEPYDADHHSEVLTGEDEMTDRVREALRAEASTSEFADEVEIETAAGIVRLRGRVPDLVDEDNLVATAEQVTGVTEVIDELDVEAAE
jgi:hypothetical protein